MDCKQFQKILYRYMDNELEDARLVADFKQHLRACPTCSLEHEKEARFNKLIKGHLIKEAAPFELREAVINRIDGVGSWKKIFSFPRFKPVPSLSAFAAVVVIVTFAFVTTFSQPFPVFAESIDRHLQHLKGGYPLEIQSNDTNEVLAWFEGKLDFAVTRPHLNQDKVTLLGARICHLKDQKVAYFIYEKDGQRISAFVMDYSQLKLPRLARSQVHDHKNNIVYVKGEKGYESVFCFHKKMKTGCILVSDMPERELMQLMG